MKFTIFVGVLLILANANFPNANAFTIQEMTHILEKGAGDDTKECAKTAVNAIAAENVDTIADFHEKSDIEKMKTLHKETMKMMQNGNDGWRAFARIYKIMEEELGGEEAFLNSYFGNYTEQLSKGTLNSTMICSILGNTEAFYKQAKKSIGTTVGESDTFWPMVKDMMTSVDLEQKDIREAPTVLIGVGNVVTFGLPDEMIHMVTSVLKLMPEKLFRKKIREMGPTLKPFPFNQS